MALFHYTDCPAKGKTEDAEVDCRCEEISEQRRQTWFRSLPPLDREELDALQAAAAAYQRAPGFWAVMAHTEETVMRKEHWADLREHQDKVREALGQDVLDVLLKAEPYRLLQMVSEIKRHRDEVNCVPKEDVYNLIQDEMAAAEDDETRKALANVLASLKCNW